MVNDRVHVHHRGRRNGYTGLGGLYPLEFVERPKQRPLKGALITSHLVEDIWF
jgi:hypothetical protein